MTWDEVCCPYCGGKEPDGDTEYVYDGNRSYLLSTCGDCGKDYTLACSLTPLTVMKGDQLP